MTIEEAKPRYYALPPEGLLYFWKDQDYPIAKVILHTHTDLGSPKDSVLTVKQYVKAAKDMGAECISVTDHGTMYAIPALYSLCQKECIKLICGCEFYVLDGNIKDKKMKKTRLHLVAYAKDQTGYKALSRLVTESNKRIVTAGKLSYPCISKELLEKYIGEGSEGYGHVIGTSACIGGVVIGQVFENEDASTNAMTLKKTLEEAEGAYNGYIEAMKELAELTAEKDRLTALSKKTYRKKQLAVNKLSGKEKEEAEEALKAEMAETEKADKALPGIRIRVSAVSKEATGMASRMEKLSRLPKNSDSFIHDFKAYLDSLKDKFEALKAGIAGEEEMAGKFEEELLWYDKLFGHGNWYAELQNHGLENEVRYMPVLARIAKAHDIPVVAANDAHMLSKEYTDARRVACALRFNKWGEPRKEEEEMYLKNDCELFKALNKIVPEETAFSAMMNREEIAKQCNVSFERSPHYPVYHE